MTESNLEVSEMQVDQIQTNEEALAAEVNHNQSIDDFLMPASIVNRVAKAVLPQGAAIG